MKKLKLSLSNMEGVEVLTRAQLKKVMGGSGGGGTCCAHSNDWSGYQCGISKAQAQDFVYNGGWDKWCCDSCASSPGYPF